VGKEPASSKTQRRQILKKPGLIKERDSGEELAESFLKRLEREKARACDFRVRAAVAPRDRKIGTH